MKAKIKKIGSFLLRILNIDYDRKNIWHNALFIIVTALMVLQCFSVMVRPTETIEYPIDDIYYSSQYIKQFDAFMKGQLHLDIKADWKLETLENPYDPAERDEEKIIYHWDHAYFEGKYYSYFGIAPILTVYFPFYLLSSELPNDAYACQILAVYAVIFMALAFREVVLRFCKKANIHLFLICMAAFISVSGVYLGVLCADIYYIAVISALGCSMAFVFFAFRAMREEKLAPRMVLLVLAALALTLTVLSRPTAAVMCIAVFPIFVEFLFNIRRENLRAGILTVCSFAVPLLMGAGFVMWYNAARFGSPFDFGANYQLTVSDISKNTIEPAFAFSSIYSYFLCPFWKTDVSPYITMLFHVVLPSNARYVYVDNYVGAFAHGLPAAILLYREVMFLDKKEHKREYTKTAFVVCTFVLAVAVAFLDFCMAGVNMRYIYDILAMLALAGSFILLDWQARLGKKGRVIMAAVCLVFFAAAFYANVGVLETIRPRI